MNQEEYLTQEHKLHLATDKVYRKHLEEMQKLTERQVMAQEKLVNKLSEVLKAINPKTGRR